MALPAETLPEQYVEDSLSLEFSDNPAAKNLLDVIVTILADEYVKTAKENPEIFSK